jgi:hypothetical protein
MSAAGAFERRSRMVGPLVHGERPVRGARFVDGERLMSHGDG